MKPQQDKNKKSAQTTKNTQEAKYLNDGVDHINVWTKGKTKLGQMLSYFFYSPFKHPYYGPFNSMEGFRYYIKTINPETNQRDDALRTLSGYRAKEHGKKLVGVYCTNFKEIINAANFHKIEQNPELKELFLESTLPFDHYFLFGPGNVVIHPKGYEWLIAGLEEIRTMMREGKRPQEIDYSGLENSGN